ILLRTTARVLKSDEVGAVLSALQSISESCQAYPPAAPARTQSARISASSCNWSTARATWRSSIDSKLRGCHLVALRVGDGAPTDTRSTATVVQHPLDGAD